MNIFQLLKKKEGCSRLSDASFLRRRPQGWVSPTSPVPPCPEAGAELGWGPAPTAGTGQLQGLAGAPPGKGLVGWELVCITRSDTSHMFDLQLDFGLNSTLFTVY